MSEMTNQNNIETDSRMMILDDGKAMLVTATFMNDKCQGITIMTEGD